MTYSETEIKIIKWMWNGIHPNEIRFGLFDSILFGFEVEAYFL